jgi:3-oxoacyl-[acyl-carrier-protein] synthase-3
MDHGATDGVRITGVGAELPPDVVTSAEVEERVGLTRAGLERGWLERVTGVRERRWAAPEVMPSALAARAGQQALDRAGLDPLAIDALLYTGITRDFIEPGTSNVVQEALAASNARVFDLTNGCNGLIDGLDVAASLIAAGRARRVLVTTGEHASISINWHARTPEELLRSAAGFVVGDGGGALVVEASDDPARGLRAWEQRSDGRHWRHAIGGRFRPTTQACAACGSPMDVRFFCDGRALITAILELMPRVMEAVLAKTGWGYGDLDLVFCHEASRRFIDTGIALIGNPADLENKIWSTVGRFGNTSTVSLPLAMSEALAAGALVPGSKVMLLAAASGVSVAAATLVW